MLILFLTIKTDKLAISPVILFIGDRDGSLFLDSGGLILVGIPLAGKLAREARVLVVTRS